MVKKIKRFFKFTPQKFLLGAAFFAISSALSTSIYSFVVLNAKLVGLPLPFALESLGCAQNCVTDFFFLQMIFDLLFWYSISSFLFHLNKVIRK